MAKPKTKKAATTKAATAVVDDDDDDDDLEEVVEAPAEEVTFGVRDVCELIKAKTGKEVKPRELRTLIRKMARDGTGRVNREVIPGNKERYSWSGPKDPEVVAIVRAFKSGELEEDRNAKLAALKERKAAKKAAEAKANKKKAKQAEAEADDEDTLDDDDDD